MWLGLRLCLDMGGESGEMSWLFSGEQGKYLVDGFPADLRAHAPDTCLVDKRGWVDTISEDRWTHEADTFSVSFSKPLGASSLSNEEKEDS